MKTIRMIDICTDRTLTVAYENAVYVFTLNQPVEVPDSLASRLLGDERPCSMGIFEEVV